MRALHTHQSKNNNTYASHGVCSGCAQRGARRAACRARRQAVQRLTCHCHASPHSTHTCSRRGVNVFTLRPHPRCIACKKAEPLARRARVGCPARLLAWKDAVHSVLRHIYTTVRNIDKSKIEKRASENDARCIHPVGGDQHRKAAPQGEPRAGRKRSSQQFTCLAETQ